MLSFPTIDPVIFSLGPLQVRWYGLMYVIGFVAAFRLVLHQARRFQCDRLLERLDNLNLVLILGVILGGRLGYVALYNPAYYLAHPFEIPATWTGGMSFHGGCLGALAAGALYCRRHGIDFWKTADLFVVTAPIGLFFGRLGNFINGELFGRVTQVPWGMVFPEGGPLPRHPSQLYEAFFEGAVLFILLWSVKALPWRRPAPGNWPHGTMLALFLLLYGLFRFHIEFFREPDAQLGSLILSLSMGQILCLLMAVGGLLLWRWRKRKTAPARTKSGQMRR